MPPSNASADRHRRWASVGRSRDCGQRRGVTGACDEQHRRRYRYRCRGHGDAEAGSASLEFITTGMILLLPLVYLVVTLSSLQAASFAAEGAARHASRVFVQAEDVEAAESAAEGAVQFALVDYGLHDAVVETTVSCTPDPGDCLRRQGTVTVGVRILVPMPLVPLSLDLATPLSVPIAASATQVVPRFRSGG